MQQRGISIPTALCILAMQFFVAAACVFIPAIGTEDDELLFVPPIYWPGLALARVRVFGHDIPTMLMSYVGADKTLLYGPILKHFPNTMWTLRLPPVLIGALTLWILYLALRRLTNPWVAVAFVWILATDTMFLLSTTFDWGPVAIQHFFVALAFLCFARETPWIFAGCAALGLAFWDKGTAIWTIGAFVISAALFLPGQIRARVSKSAAIRAGLGFVAGALPILIFNIEHPLATFRENAGFTTEALQQKLLIMWITLNGTGMFNFLVRGNAPRLHSLAPGLILLASGLVWLPRVRPVRPLALFALSTGLIIWCGMLFVRAGGVSIHHSILVWPWPYIFAVVVLAWALGESTRGKAIFALLVVTVVVSNLSLVKAYAKSAWSDGPSMTWSDATLGLPEEWHNARHILVLDWGISNMAIFRSHGGAPIEDHVFSGIQESDLKDLSGTEFVTHAPGQEIVTGNNAKFDTAIARAGLLKQDDAIVRDSRGNPFLEIFHCIPSPQPPQSIDK